MSRLSKAQAKLTSLRDLLQVLNATSKDEEKLSASALETVVENCAGLGLELPSYVKVTLVTRTLDELMSRRAYDGVRDALSAKLAESDPRRIAVVGGVWVLSPDMQKRQQGALGLGVG